MSRAPSEATQLKTAKRQLSEAHTNLCRARSAADFWEKRAIKAEQEVAEWKARFDILLRREGPAA